VVELSEPEEAKKKSQQINGKIPHSSSSTGNEKIVDARN
jgi:hypothetical protein